MRIITPSEAITRLSLFNQRISRLESDSYTNPRFRTADLNRLKSELRSVIFNASIAIHSKNEERSKKVVSLAKQNYKTAFKIRENEML